MRIEELHENGDFDCPICRNTWYVSSQDEQGYWYAKPCKCKQERMLIRSIIKSGITIRDLKSKTLDTFEATEEWQKKMIANAKGFLADPKNGIGYFGRSGTGKTHICFGVMIALIEQGKHCVYFPYRNVMKILLQKQFNNREQYQVDMKKYAEAEVLYIDDMFKLSFDKEGNISKSELQILFELINDRYINHRITIFSSEHSTEKMGFFDEAIASRVYEMCSYGFRCEGENQRYVRRRRR